MVFGQYTDQDFMHNGTLWITKRTARVTIDNLNDFMVPSKGSLFVEGLPHEVPLETYIRNSLELCKYPYGYRVLGNDCHPPDHREFRKLGIVHAQRGTWGQEYFLPLLKIMKEADEILLKGTDKEVFGYSVITSRTFPLHVENLEDREITDILLDGVALNYCVISAAVVYSEQGYNVYIVRDATRSVPHPLGDEEEFVRHKMMGHRIKFVMMDQLDGK